MTDHPISVEAGLAWALVWMGVVVFLFAILWGFLNPYMGMDGVIAKTTQDASTNSSPVNTGLNRVMIVWNLAPLWVGLGLLYYGYRRAINESKRNPGR